MIQASLSFHRHAYGVVALIRRYCIKWWEVFTCPVRISYFIQLRPLPELKHNQRAASVANLCFGIPAKNTPENDKRVYSYQKVYFGDDPKTHSYNMLLTTAVCKKQ